MDYVTTVINGLKDMRAGVLMIIAGMILIMMSATQSWGALEINAAMGDKLFNAGCVIFLLGAFYSWYRTMTESHQVREKEVYDLHARIEELERQGRAE